MRLFGILRANEKTRFACGTTIVQLDLVEVRPSVQRSGDKLRPVIDLDSAGQSAGCLDFFQHFADLLALDRFVHVNGRIFPAEHIRHGRRPEPLPIIQLIRYEVHAPAFV